MSREYTPPKIVLERYADVLVNFAIGGGKGMKKGDVVRISAEESAKPLFIELRKAVWKAGGHVLSSYLPSDKDGYNVQKDFFDCASDEQLKFFATKYLKGMVDTMDHSIAIISEDDKQALKGVDPKKLMAVGEARKPLRDWLTKKENAGKYTWTLALYGTEAMAKEAGLSLKEFWDQIIYACFLDKPNPVAEWRKVTQQIKTYEKKLNALKAKAFHIEGPDADLTITMGEKRKFISGRGANIPSFEIFTSPDWRGTNGWIQFNQPLYRYGNKMEGIRLEFKDGVVVSATAKTGENVLKQMIATPNADKVGEFSMTDARHSRITKFMAETLYDENVGGKHGNTHIAVGNSYHDCYDGDSSKVTKAGWKKLGFNSSSVHTDIVSTAPRTVTAILQNGREKIVYKNGQFVL